jgi:hypothetical protein
MSNASKPKVKCRFCGDQFRGFSALKGHVSDKHAKEADAIAASMPDRVLPSGTLPGRFDGHARGASVGAEFRRRMGYSSGEPG